MKKKLLAILLANFCGITFLSAQYTGGIGDGAAVGVTAQVLPTPVITSNSPVCDGGDIILNAPFFTGATYHWTGPNGYDVSALELNTTTITDVTVNEAGLYNLVITLSGGAYNDPAAETEVIVANIPSDPSAIIGTDLVCGIDDTIQPYSITANPQYESYLWEVIPLDAIDSISSGGTNAKTIYWSSAYSGDATVRVAGENFCGTSNYATLNVNVAPILGASNLPESDEICFGVVNTTIAVDSISNATDYIWELDPPVSGTITYGSSDTIIDIEWVSTYTGTVDIILQYVNDCFDERDTLLFTINELPLTDVIEDAEICDGDEINIGGTSNPDYSYSWTSDPPGFTSSEANPLVSPAEDTEYYLEVTDNNTSCINNDTVVITVLPLTATPDLPSGETTVIVDGENPVSENYSTSSANAIGYIWSLNPESAGTITGGNSSDISVEFAGGYTGDVELSVEAYNDCDTTDPVSLQISVLLSIHGVNKEVVKIYPNPASDNLFIETIADFKNYELVLYNSFGQVVIRKQMHNAIETIDVSSVSKGLYTIELTFDNKVYKHKLFIQ